MNFLLTATQDEITVETLRAAQTHEICGTVAFIAFFTFLGFTVRLAFKLMREE